jgi:hypothetical protein
MTEESAAPRTYNQVHAPRKYAAGRRRVSVYVSWTYPGEANQEVSDLDNRYSTITEVRRATWPRFEWAADPLAFHQGIAGSLELFFRAWRPFQEIVGDATGYEVPMFQRVDQAGYRLPLDERVLADVDTLLVFGLDLLRTEQAAAPEEIEALRQFLAREGTGLLIGPHHDVGRSDDPGEREEEYLHHGDPLVPRQQRFGAYTRSLLLGLGVPIDNRWGLHPAVVGGTGEPAPLTIARDLDTRGWLTGVTSFNLHPHLPHYAVTAEDTSSIRVLARQPIERARPHPFTDAGNRELNAFLWLPPGGARAGDVLVADSTIFSTLFGLSDSLKRLWLNLVT